MNKVRTEAEPTFHKKAFWTKLIQKSGTSSKSVLKSLLRSRVQRGASCAPFINVSPMFSAHLLTVTVFR